MKKKLLLLLAVLATAINASAENYILYTSEDGNVVEPKYPNVFGATIVSNTYENGLGKILFDGEVSKIGEQAFWCCRSLTSMEIPNSVTSIGSCALAGCSRLTSMVIPNSITEIGRGAFQDCSRLTSVVIPNSVTEIGYNAFNGCSSLISVEIPNSVTLIESSMFRNCTSLTSVLIPNSVTSIRMSAFYGCSSLTSVEIPNSVTEIERDAFRGCSSLVSFTGKFASDDHRCLIVDGVLIASAPANLTTYEIPNSVTSIGEWAFQDCSSLTSVTIPNSVTSIGEGTFCSCSSLTSVVIPNSVTEIGSDAFFYCSSLTSFIGKFASEDNRCLIVYGVLNSFAPAGLTTYEIPNSVTEIGESAFSWCTSLTSVTIPNSVTSIGEWAFNCCSNLTSVTIPNSVTSIGEGAFAWCNLTSVEIPNSVTLIGNYAFKYCRNLASTIIGNSVTEIGEQAFYDCSSLKEITSLAVTPPSIYENTFGDVSKEECVLNVPAESVEAYKSADYWKDFFNIVGINATGISTPSVNGLHTGSKAYNLSGAAANDGYRGIVIKNGKKVLRK